MLSIKLYSASTATFNNESQFIYTNNVSIISSGTTKVLQLNNQFTKLNLLSFPSKRFSYSMSFSSTTNSIFLFAGKEGLNYKSDSWKFDCATNNWTQVFPSTFPSARAGHCVVNVGGDKFIIFGGVNNIDGYLNDTYFYSLVQTSFTKIITSITPDKRAYFGSCYASDYDRLYIFGGQGSEGNYFNDLWYFDVKSSSWVCVGSTTTVNKLSEHKIVYVPNKRSMYLFGGKIDGSNINYSSAVWKYNIEESSFSLVGFMPFGGITNFGITYFENLDKILILFGEKRYSPIEFLEDLYFYDITTTSFTKNLQPYLNLPSKRKNFDIVSTTYSVIMYGGYDGLEYSDTYIYKYSYSGEFITQSYYPSIINPTNFGYKKINYFPPEQLSGVDIKFQIAYSTSPFGPFSNFLGPTDSQSSYYQFDTAISTTNNNKYIMIKGFLSTSKIPNNPYFNPLNLIYNFVPYKPALMYPQNTSSTNTVTVELSWTAGSDPEINDTEFVYKLQISRTTDFSFLVYEQEVSTNYKKVPSLSTGKYYWRVATKDFYDYGEFSNYYELEIDTTAPNRPYSFSAKTGPNNGEIVVSLRISGDDGDFGLFNGFVVVGFSSTTIIDTEEKFNNATLVEIGVANKSPSSEFSTIVRGLLNDTTYYLNIKLKDDAGNLSEISTSAVSALTNFTPKVSMIYPISFTTLSGNVTFSWIYSDYNETDTHNFSLMISSDDLVYTNIVSNLPNFTTTYLWNSFLVKNSTYYIKIICRDNKGLEGYEIINNIEIKNDNLPPQIISWVFPKQNDVLSKKVTIYWEMYDPNFQDTHKYKLYISTDNNVFSLVEEIFYDTTFYILDTTKYMNSPNYRLKLWVTDGEYYSELVSEQFSIINQNVAPSKPELVFPKNNSFISVLKIKFLWEKSIDENEGDIIVYDFYLSTAPNGEPYFVSKTSITKTEYEIFYPAISERKTYYWYIKSRDQFGLITQSEIYKFTTYEKNKTITSDYQVYVELLDGLTENVFIFAEKICDDKRQLKSISVADSKDKLNRLIKIIPYEVYKITLYDADFNELQQELRYKLIFSVDTKKYTNIVPIKTLKISRLDEKRNEWVFTEYSQKSEQRPILNLANDFNITTQSNKFGIYTVLARNTVEQPVSNIRIYPNPCNINLEQIKIEYVLTENVDVKIQIFTLSGGMVKEMFYFAGISGISSGVPEGSLNEIFWDGKNDKGMKVANGMYICKMFFGDKVEQRYIGIVKK